MKSLSALRKPKLLTEPIIELLREAILDRRLKPGERIVERQLATQWDISRAPLREAIRQLSSEGLITLSPHRGARVRDISREELTELFAIRLMIETFAARLAVDAILPEQIRNMEMLVKEMKSFLKNQDLASFSKAGMEFHVVLLAASGNKLLAEMYDQTKRKFSRYQLMMSRVPNLPNASVKEHEQIIEALKARSSRQAILSIEKHIRHLLEQFSIETP
jgi:DNA-binding GntR family transcriptional regulator